MNAANSSYIQLVSRMIFANGMIEVFSSSFPAFTTPPITVSTGNFHVFPVLMIDQRLHLNCSLCFRAFSLLPQSSASPLEQDIVKAHLFLSGFCRYVVGEATNDP